MKHKLAAIRKSIQEHAGWRWFLLSTVLLGATMSALDVSIVNVAMPTLKHTFGVSMAVIEWVAMAYMLALVIFFRCSENSPIYSEGRSSIISGL